MKKLLVVLALLAVPKFAFAYSFGNLYDDTKVTVLKSASLGHFYSLQEGKSMFEATDAVLTCRFITFDLGYTTGFNSGERGSILGGPTVHLDKLLAEFTSVPAITTKIFIPESAVPFWDKVYLGFRTGWNADNGSFQYGLSSGLEFAF